MSGVHEKCKKVFVVTVLCVAAAGLDEHVEVVLCQGALEAEVARDAVHGARVYKLARGQDLPQLACVDNVNNV